MSNKDTRVKNLSGMGQLIMDINNRRCDSEVFINQKMDVTELVKYIEKQKKKGKNITFFHAFAIAIGKTIYNRDRINCYIKKRHLYMHNDVVLSFSAKVQFNDSAEELMIMVPIDKNDNIFTISDQIAKKVEKIRQHREDSDTTKGANDAMEILGKLPNILRVPVVGLFKFLDSKLLLPKFLKEDNLYYSSMIVSNIGSLHCGAIYHHLSEFGTCSSLTTIGEIKDEVVVIDGKKEIRKMCEFGITLDERIADGYYFIKSCKLIEYLFKNPELLEDDADTKIVIPK